MVSQRAELLQVAILQCEGLSMPEGWPQALCLVSGSLVVTKRIRSKWPPSGLKLRYL